MTGFPKLPLNVEAGERSGPGARDLWHLRDRSYFGATGRSWASGLAQSLAGISVEAVTAEYLRLQGAAGVA